MVSTVFISRGQSVSGEVFSPSSSSPLVSVIVVYGTEGMRDPFGGIIRDFFAELASHGMLSFVPDYFMSTGTTPGFESVFSPVNAKSRFDRWTEILVDAAAHAQTLPGVVAGSTAFVGFSLGGHLVLKAAAETTVKAVVDFY